MIYSKKILFLLSLFTLHKGLSQSLNNKEFISAAIEVANKNLDSIFGKKLMNSAVKLNLKKSEVDANCYHNKYTLEQYDYMLKPVEINLTYDLIYQNYVVTDINIPIDSNLKIKRREMFEVPWDNALMNGWKLFLLGKFKFNFERIKKIISQPANNIIYRLSLWFEPTSKEIIKGFNFFVELKYYWHIEILEDSKGKNDEYYVQRTIKEMLIDVNSGKVYAEKVYPKKMPMPL